MYFIFNVSFKVAAIATLVSGPRPTPYIFRNYCHAENANPYYPGAYNVRPWEAVRASAAAPGYFQDYKISNNVFLVILLILRLLTSTI